MGGFGDEGCQTMRPWRASSEEAVPAEQAAAGPDRTPVTTLLDQLLLPRLTEQLRTAREWFAGNASATEHLNRVSRSLDDFVAQRRPEAAPGPPAGVTVPFDRMATEVRAVRDDEYAATRNAPRRRRATPASRPGRSWSSPRSPRCWRR